MVEPIDLVLAIVLTTPAFDLGEGSLSQDSSLSPPLAGGIVSFFLWLLCDGVGFLKLEGHKRSSQLRSGTRLGERRRRVLSDDGAFGSIGDQSTHI